MTLKDSVLSKQSQSQKVMYYMSLFTENYEKNQWLSKDRDRGRVWQQGDSTR